MLEQDRGDPPHPSVARVYDYYLGGTANTAADRDFGAEVLARFPFVRRVAMANRIFLGRAVRHLVRSGIRQFVDIGSGIPAMGSTHAVADQLAPGVARVVYIDHDAGAVDRARAVLEEGGEPARHTILLADLREPERLWRLVAGTGLIDPTEPIGLLMIAVLHLRQPDGSGIDRGPWAVAHYRKLLPSGSYLAISHATKEGVPENLKTGLTAVGQMYGQRVGAAQWRTRAGIAALFGDFELIHPGVTWAPLWHPEESAPGAPSTTFASPAESIVLAGIGRKP